MVPTVLGAFTKLRKSLLASCLSVRVSARNKSAPTGRIIIKFDLCVFLENMSRKFKFHSNQITLTSTLHENQYTFFIISRPFLLSMRNVSDKSYRENQNTQFMFDNVFRESCRL